MVEKSLPCHVHKNKILGRYMRGLKIGRESVGNCDFLLRKLVDKANYFFDGDRGKFG